MYVDKRCTDAGMTSYLHGFVPKKVVMEVVKKRWSLQMNDQKQRDPKRGIG